MNESAEEQITLPNKYELTFRGGVARDVLTDIILRICGYGSTMDPEDAGAIARHNVAVDILSMTGVHPQRLVEWITGRPEPKKEDRK